MARGALTVGYETAILEAVTCIDQVMEERGITRKELAERLNVDPSRVTRLLNDPDNITVRTFYRLCNAVGLKPSIRADRGPWLAESSDWTVADRSTSLRLAGTEGGDDDDGEGAFAA
jgi:transcriptional regulator with XRE-family HTH domain